PLRARRHLAHGVLEEPPPVTGALDEAGHRARGQAQQLVEAELEGPLDGVALDAQPPGARVQDRRRGVVAHEEVAGRCEITAERLQSGLLVDAVVDEDLARQGLDMKLLRRRLGKRCAACSKAGRRRGTGGKELPTRAAVLLNHRHRVLLSVQSDPGFSGSNPSGRRIIIATSTSPTRICCAAASRTPVKNGITSLAKRLPSRRPSSTTEPRSAPRLLPLPPRLRASH